MNALIPSLSRVHGSANAQATTYKADRQAALGSGFDIDGGVRGGIVLDAFSSINTVARVETAEMHGDDDKWTVTAYVTWAWED
ncbi:hypothetical protein ETD86_28805 [Nonomuraea turkmeniaca]|uniref:Uncharacterized protein n=1 Tax=Nonomuraea turkmeniaca TaxID=103838 RepID=A0A5S4FAT5_9ACTN|nr:hypothetical protein [Nonomuraea turkmeniaca]TMR14349.1 hypothetical protein ETD86_28805 [Nonomuraea turkmeniaca]